MKEDKKDNLGFINDNGSKILKVINRTDSSIFFNIRKICKVKELNDIIVINQLNSDLTININTEKPTIIVTDNEDYNSTYLLDIVVSFLEVYDDMEFMKKISGTDIVYIDYIPMRLMLSNNLEIKNETIKKICEKIINNNICIKTYIEKLLPPSLLTVNKNLNDFGILQENNLHVLNGSDILDAFKYLYKL